MQHVSADNVCHSPEDSNRIIPNQGISTHSPQGGSSDNTQEMVGYKYHTSSLTNAPVQPEQDLSENEVQHQSSDTGDYSNGPVTRGGGQSK